MERVTSLRPTITASAPVTGTYGLPLDPEAEGLRSRINLVCGERSNRELDRLLGLNRETIRRYRVGMTPPTAQFVTRLCSAFGVASEWLLFGTGPTFAAPASTEPARLEHS